MGTALAILLGLAGSVVSVVGGPAAWRVWNLPQPRRRSDLLTLLGALVAFLRLAAVAVRGPDDAVVALVAGSLLGSRKRSKLTRSSYRR